MKEIWLQNFIRIRFMINVVVAGDNGGISHTQLPVTRPQALLASQIAEIVCGW